MECSWKLRIMHSHNRHVSREVRLRSQWCNFSSESSCFRRVRGFMQGLVHSGVGQYSVHEVDQNVFTSLGSCAYTTLAPERIVSMGSIARHG